MVPVRNGDDGWQAWSKHVVISIEDTDKRLLALDDRCDKCREDVLSRIGDLKRNTDLLAFKVALVIGAAVLAIEVLIRHFIK